MGIVVTPAEASADNVSRTVAQRTAFQEILLSGLLSTLISNLQTVEHHNILIRESWTNSRLTVLIGSADRTREHLCQDIHKVGSFYITHGCDTDLNTNSLRISDMQSTCHSTSHHTRTKSLSGQLETVPHGVMVLLYVISCSWRQFLLHVSVHVSVQCCHFCSASLLTLHFRGGIL